MHAGPEIGVAATKSFTSQVTILALIGLLLGRMRHLSTSQGSRVIEALEALPDQIESALKLSDQIRSVAKKYVEAETECCFSAANLIFRLRWRVR